MRELKVGELLEPGVVEYDEMPEYNYRGGAHVLIIPMNRPTPEEIEAVRSAALKLAFTVIDDILIFQFRCGSTIPWSDAVYTWYRVPPAEQARPPRLTGEQRALLTVILVDAETGIIEALRVVSMSPTFARRLHQAIERQIDGTFPTDYDDRVARLFNAHTSRQLRDRALATCNAGDTIDRPSPY